MSGRFVNSSFCRRTLSPTNRSTFMVCSHKNKDAKFGKISCLVPPNSALAMTKNVLCRANYLTWSMKGEVDEIAWHFFNFPLLLVILNWIILHLFVRFYYWKFYVYVNRCQRYNTFFNVTDHRVIMSNSAYPVQVFPEARFLVLGLLQPLPACPHLWMNFFRGIHSWART